jgi:hypothetical protein
MEMECPNCLLNMAEDPKDLFTCTCGAIVDLRMMDRPNTAVPSYQKEFVPMELPVLPSQQSPTGTPVVKPSLVPVLVAVGGVVTVLGEAMTDPATFTKEGLLRLGVRVVTFLLAAISPGLRRVFK